MTFPAYPEYKTSSLEWLGRVPSHWKEVRLKNILAQRITDGPHLTPMFVDEGVPFLSVDGIQNGELVFESCRYISHEDHAEFCKKAKPQQDDILMGKAASTGKIARVKVDFYFSIWSPLALIRIQQANAVPAYVEYTLSNHRSQAEIDTLCTSNTQKNISMDDIPRLTLCLPPLDEQRAITNFLEHETAKIDSLIREQDKLIELLNEKRQSIISNAVCRGLDPNVPMKDSGVECLGMVPEHWNVVRLKYITTTWKGFAFKAELFCNDGVRVVKASDIKSLTIKSSDVCLPVELAVNYPKLKSGDLVVSTVGSGPEVLNSAVGQIGIVPKILEGSLLNQNTVVIRSKSKKINQDFLAYVLQSSNYRSHLNVIAHGTANQSSINIEDMLHFRSPLPPLDEQSKIVVVIRNETSRIDELISNAGQGIVLLQERRSALISAAVSGQIDVRNFYGN